MEDIFYNIFILLPIKDIIACTQVNKMFNRVIQLEQLWFVLFKRDFSGSNIFKINYYETYILHTKLNKLENKYCLGVNIYNDKSLNLGYSRYTSNMLPTEICELIQLEKLKLYYNNLETLPTEIGQLTNLICLDLYCNRLTSLPMEISRLTNLIELDVRLNSLNPLPKEITELPNLKRLLFYMDAY